jgi:hypothetical protein
MVKRREAHFGVGEEDLPQRREVAVLGVANVELAEPARASEYVNVILCSVASTSAKEQLT